VPFAAATAHRRDAVLVCGAVLECRALAHRAPRPQFIGGVGDLRALPNRTTRSPFWNSSLGCFTRWVQLTSESCEVMLASADDIDWIAASETIDRDEAVDREHVVDRDAVPAARRRLRGDAE
jgi:hypothetical protein